MSTQPITGKGRARREQILRHTARLIAERGVAATSLDDVIAAAGVSKSQLYHYFFDRDDLIEAAVAYRCDEFMGQLTEQIAAVDSLAALCRWLDLSVQTFAAGGCVGGCPMGSLAGELAEHNAGARARLAAAFDTWERALAAAFERMRDRGELDASASPQRLATALLAALEGGLLLSQLRRDVSSLRIALDAAMAQVRVFAKPAAPGRAS